MKDAYSSLVRFYKYLLFFFGLLLLALLFALIDKTEHTNHHDTTDYQGRFAGKVEYSSVIGSGQILFLRGERVTRNPGSNSISLYSASGTLNPPEAGDYFFTSNVAVFNDGDNELNLTEDFSITERNVLTISGHSIDIFLVESRARSARPVIIEGSNYTLQAGSMDALWGEGGFAANFSDGVSVIYN